MIAVDRRTHTSGLTKTRGTVYVVVDGPTADLIVSVLVRNGYDVYAAGDGTDALRQLVELAPDLTIVDIARADAKIVDYLRRVDAATRANRSPVIFLTPSGGPDDSTRGLGEPSGGFLALPIRPPELVARVRASLGPNAPKAKTASPERRKAERNHLLSEHAYDAGIPHATRRALLSEQAFDAECSFDIARADRRRTSLSFGYLELFEFAGIREAVGQRGQALIAREVVSITDRFRDIARLGIDGNGRFVFLIHGSSTVGRDVLNTISRAIAAHRFHLGKEPIRLTPIVAVATRTDRSTTFEMRRRASVALASAAAQLDLQTVTYTPRLELTTKGVGSFSSRTIARLRALATPLVVPLQIVATLTGCLVLPFFAYWFLASHGADISDGVYLVCVIMLVLTAVGIVWESVLSLKIESPPSAGVYPAASAIIAAYLPNEAATIIETVEAFLSVQYAADLQIVLAYNTPRSLPMEEELDAIAARNPRFVPMRIYGSTSKAQNVNAALRVVSGTFVGVFDADHKPDPDSFTRAWDWLASGYDVVQGHCAIRNGSESFVARLIAVEFESIYAVSHPGRTRLHGFGIFGGSNGYWKTDLLRQTRMHRFMLTEDIDSSLRVIEAGYRIASDRNLISRELAPLTFRAFWHQRLRWAQGWFQVTLKHLMPAMRSPHLSLRQKAGVVHLLLWRECYVWMCLQVLPILAFWLFVRHANLNWFVPVFLATTIFTTLTGPIQLLFTYFLADREIRANRSWFASYLFASMTFFGEFKNLITRLAHVKELFRERAWQVTPRTSQAPGAASK